MAGYINIAAASIALDPDTADLYAAATTCQGDLISRYSYESSTTPPYFLQLTNTSDQSGALPIRIENDKLVAPVNGDTAVSTYSLPLSASAAPAIVKLPDPLTFDDFELASDRKSFASISGTDPLLREDFGFAFSSRVSANASAAVGALQTLSVIR